MLKGILVLVALVFAMSARAGALDPFVGTWKLNPAESQFDPNHHPLEGTMTFEIQPDGSYVMQAEGTKEGGQKVKEQPQKFFVDGQPRPLPEMPALSVVATRPDPNTIRSEARRQDGSIVGSATYAVSTDGRSMKATVSGIDSQLRSFTQITIWNLQLMSPEELTALPSRAPDRRIAYGSEASQYGELRIPAGRGPHPLVVLIHGGCFKAAYATAHYFGAMADALKEDGIATWNIEYRRLGEPGSGWPGTYLDVGRAVDYVRTIAGEHHLDLGRVVVVGHSAGGHLAMWAAARRRLAKASDLYVADPLPVRGVLDLAGLVDMTANIPVYEALCGDPVITSLLGGTPAAVPEHYTQASAIMLLPLGMPQVLVTGSREEFLTLPLADAYVKTATGAGDPVRHILIPGAGHFEIASPLSSTWPEVKAAIRSLVDGKLPS